MMTPTSPFSEPLIATVKEAANLTRLSQPTLWRMRAGISPGGPPWFRSGGRVFYPMHGLRDWAAGRVTEEATQ